MHKLLNMNGILNPFAGMSGNVILQISAPKPLLQISPPNSLLISEPVSDVSVYLHEYDKGLRCLNLYLINPNLDSHVELLEGIFNAVTSHEAFINFGKFKSIIVSAVMYKGMDEITVSGSTEYNFHHNVLIDPTTTFNQYYKQVGEFVNYKLEHGYGSEVIEYYKVRVWNLDLMKNAKIKLHNKGRIDLLGYRSYSTLNRGKITISPINSDKTTNNFASMDLETININGNQEPIAITTCNSKTSKLFIIDPVLIKKDIELAIKNLWSEYFDYLIKSGDHLIFAHNLLNYVFV